MGNGNSLVVVGVVVVGVVVLVVSVLVVVVLIDVLTVVVDVVYSLHIPFSLRSTESM